MAVVASAHQMLQVNQPAEQRTAGELEGLTSPAFAACPRGFGLSVDAAASSLSTLKLEDHCTISNSVPRQKSVPFWAAGNNAALGKQSKSWPASGVSSSRASTASPDGSFVSKESSDGGKTPCAFFLRLGSCGFGDRCKFSHPAELAPRVQYNSHGLPLRPRAPDCSYYLKNHSCGFGPLCKYNHPEPSLSPASSMSSQGQWGSPSSSARGSLLGVGSNPPQAPAMGNNTSHLQAVIAAQLAASVPVVSAAQAPAAVPFVSMVFPPASTQASPVLDTNQLLGSFPAASLGQAGIHAQSALDSLSMSLLQARLGHLP